MSKKLVDISSGGIPMIEENRAVFNNTNAASLNLLQNFQKAQHENQCKHYCDKNTQTSQNIRSYFLIMTLSLILKETIGWQNQNNRKVS